METDWNSVQYFKKSEFTDPDKMNPELIKALDIYRRLVGNPVIIHSSYREGDSGQHGKGNAVDIHVKGISLIDAYLLAEKTGLFNGIGVYSWWNNKGLHLDVRPLKEGSLKARWACDRSNHYIGLNWFFIRKVYELEKKEDENGKQM